MVSIRKYLRYHIKYHENFYFHDILYMRKVIKNRINKKPLLALAMILFGIGIAFYTNASGKEGFEKKDEKKDDKKDTPATAPTAPTAPAAPATASATAAAAAAIANNKPLADAIGSMLTPEQKKTLGLA